MVRLKIWIRNVANPADWRPTEHSVKGPTLELASHEAELVIRDLQAKYRMPEMEYVALEMGEEPIPTEQV